MFSSAIQKCCSAFACTSTLVPGVASHSGLHLQSNSVPSDQCHSIDACLKTKYFQPSFKRNSHDLQNGKSLVMKSFPEYPEDDKLRILKENPEHSEKRNLAQLVSRKEFYLRENEVKMARNTGIGIGDEKMETYLMNALLSKSPDGSTLSGMNIAVFDLHSRRFAERLLNAGVSSLSIIETSQYEAQKAKEYTEKIRKKKGLIVGAYRANMESLFPLCTRKKQIIFPAKLLFANQQLMKSAINPFKLLKESAAQIDDESGNKQRFAPIIIGCLPTVSQQSNMLTSMIFNLIMHLCAVKKDTMFQYGAIQLITFLSASNFVLATCAVDPNMQFVSNGIKHKSWLLNKLFAVKPLSGYSGFPYNTFSPPFPLSSSFSYEKKFNSIGIRNENLYGVTIEPKNEIDIGNLNLLVSSNEEILMKYAFWITFTGKMTAKTKVAQKLREWLPKANIDLSSLVESDAKVADLKLEDFDKIFSLLHIELNDDFAHIGELRNFYAHFRPAIENAKFAD
uniref:Bm2867 n=2 Tax=Brugia TaxID=6278 RepID=A0A5S6PIR2_BRUMA